MKEIRIHGRGGQGSLVLAQFMAIAALEDGKFAQAFPYLGGGGERRGKPIVAFCRLSANPIRIRCRVSEPDYVIVQDPTILSEEDVLEGIGEDGLLIINSDKSPDTFSTGEKSPRIRTFAADLLARKILGRPIINTALLGIFAGLTGEISLGAAVNAVRGRFSGPLGEKNAQAVVEGFQQATGRMS